MGFSIQLQQCLADAYKLLAQDGNVYRSLIDQFSELITNAAGKEVGISFREYCEKELKLGTFDFKTLERSRFMVLNMFINNFNYLFNINCLICG